MFILAVKPYVFIKNWLSKLPFVASRLGESLRGFLLHFLPVFAVLFLFLSANYWLATKSSFAANGGILGGPEAPILSISQETSLALLVAVAPTIAKTGNYNSAYDSNDFLVGDDSSFANAGTIIGDIFRKQNGIFLYKVQKGDTLELLAKAFGVSTSTITWANASVRNGKKLSLNQELIILPVSGILHQAATGDTIESVADLYRINPQEIKKVNALLGDHNDLNQGQKIIIPDGKPKKDLALLVKSTKQLLPDLKSYFIFPTEKSSWNWGILHPNNAVDIANICGTDIYASADGLVTEVGNPDTWNAGYGGFVKIEHQNGAITLYTHTEANIISVGDIVKQGQKIAKIGKSGNVHGTTGCHLHFEVLGARNPFIK